MTSTQPHFGHSFLAARLVRQCPTVRGFLLQRHEIQILLHSGQLPDLRQITEPLGASVCLPVTWDIITVALHGCWEDEVRGCT